MCHSTGALRHVKTPDGKLLVQGKEVTGFTNGEEEAVGLTKVVPFLVEDEMLKLGAVFSKKANWAVHVVRRWLTDHGTESSFLGSGREDADGGGEAKGRTGCHRSSFVDRISIERPPISTAAVAARCRRGAFNGRLAYGTDPIITFKEPDMSKPEMRRTTEKAQIWVTRLSAAYWRVTFDNPPLNVMGPQFVRELGEIITAVEADQDVKVLVFESAVEGFFLNHSDFFADLKDLTSMPQGPTGLEAWPDILVRITRMPVASIALIRGRATGNGSEIALACDMSFASREKSVFSQWEVGVGLVAGGGPMARLPRLIGRGRALEVLLGSDDIRGDLAESFGYVNRSLPDAELDGFVDALATRIASFDKWAIANTKRLVNAASLPPDVEIAAGWDACMTSITRPAAQEKIKALMERGFHKPGDVEDRLGYYAGQLGR